MFCRSVFDVIRMYSSKPHYLFMRFMGALVLLVMATGIASAQTAKPSPTPRRPLPKPASGSRGFDRYAGRDASKRLVAVTGTRRIENPITAADFCELGKMDYADGKYNQAINEFAQALKLDPGLAEAHFGLALTRAETGKLKEAIEEFEQTLKITDSGPLKITSNYYMGDAYADLGEYQKAITAYKEAILLDPTLAKPHYNLGVAYIALGQIVEGITEFNQAVQRRVGQGSDYAEARYNIGVASLQLGRKREANDQLQRLTKLDRELTAKLRALIRKGI